MTNDRRELIITICDAKQEILPLDDGFMYYFPSTGGALSAVDLRIIADELDRRNEPWQKKLDEYFDTCTCPTVDGVPVTGSSCPKHGLKPIEWP